MKKQEREKLSVRWFNKANNIWLYAQAGFENTSLTSPFCFDCHQVVELYLKGYLAYLEIKPLRTHNLPQLLDLCSKRDTDFRQLANECQKLNKYYITTRYPTFPFPEYSKSEAEEARENVRDIISFINQKIIKEQK